MTKIRNRSSKSARKISYQTGRIIHASRMVGSKNGGSKESLGTPFRVCSHPPHTRTEAEPPEGLRGGTGAVPEWVLLYRSEAPFVETTMTARMIV